MEQQITLLLLSLLGITLLGILARRLWPIPLLLDKARVQRALARYSEPLVASSIAVSSDHTTALATIHGSQDLALCLVLGDRVVVRRITAGSIAAWSFDDNSLKLSFDDFTCPKVSTHFTNKENVKNWLESLTQKAPA